MFLDIIVETDEAIIHPILVNEKGSFILPIVIALIIAIVVIIATRVIIKRELSNAKSV